MAECMKRARAAALARQHKPLVVGMTRAETEHFIADATEHAERSMSNVDRSWLVADLRDARMYLAALRGETK